VASEQEFSQKETLHDKNYWSLLRHPCWEISLLTWVPIFRICVLSPSAKIQNMFQPMKFSEIALP